MSGTTPATVDLAFSSLSATICAELAAGLAKPADIRRRYEITRNEWDKLTASPFFRNMLKQALKDLQGDLNAGKRITIKSEIALEDSIPLLHQWAHDPEIAIGNRLDAIKQMSVLAGRTGRDASAGGGAGGGGFNVNIVVKGNAPERQVIDVTSTPALEEPVEADVD